MYSRGAVPLTRPLAEKIHTQKVYLTLPKCA